MVKISRRFRRFSQILPSAVTLSGVEECGKPLSGTCVVSLSLSKTLCWLLAAPKESFGCIIQKLVVVRKNVEGKIFLMYFYRERNFGVPKFTFLKNRKGEGEVIGKC